MKKRMIVAAIGIPVLLLVVLLAPDYIVTALIALLSAACIFEFAKALDTAKYFILLSTSLLYAAAIPFWAYYAKSSQFLLSILLLYMVVIMAWLMLRNQKVAFDQVAPFLLGAVTIPFAMSTLVTLLGLGREYMLLPFALAFASDGGAYFAGIYLGKHRITPNLSPNKTAEGVIGGFLGAIVAAALFCVVMLILKRSVMWLGVLIYGILGSAISQFGDLAFSYIKRQYGIKDYGKLLPGHGGVLDRFDSILFCAPFVLLLISAMPLFFVK